MAKLAVMVGQIRAGNAAKKAGDIEARELSKRAGVRRAVGHREAAEEQRDADDDEEPARTAGELVMTDRLIDLVLFQLHGIDPADVEGLGGETVPS